MKKNHLIFILIFSLIPGSSLYGQKSKDISMVIEIPANTTSTIVLPKGDLLINKQAVRESDFAKNFITGKGIQSFELGSGVYNLVLKP